MMTCKCGRFVKPLRVFIDPKDAKRYAKEPSYYAPPLHVEANCSRCGVIKDPFMWGSIDDYIDLEGYG